MKYLVVIALAIVGINGLPNTKLAEIDWRNERFVTDSIASSIQDISQAIKDYGLDPLHIQNLSTGYALPVPVLFNAELLIEELLFTGLSNIVINNLNFSLLTYRVTFNISLPLIELNIRQSELDVEFFGNKHFFSASGRLAIRNIRTDGNVRVNVGIISGITLRSLDINVRLGGIESALNVVVFDRDISGPLNTLLGTIIPDTLKAFTSEIKELVEIIATDIISDML